MNRLLCLLTLATLTSLAAARAAEQTITFAVPEVDGRISLGVYDANKKLVRTLATGATDQDFKIGLNGLITTWDGKNDAGEPLPAGKYDVKGYVVSDSVKSEGEAFHFNDWVTDEDDPRLANPQVIWAQGEGVFLAGDGFIANPITKYSETGGLQFVIATFGGQWLGGSGSTAAFNKAQSSTRPTGVVLVNFQSNYDVSYSASGESFSSAAIWRGKLYLSPVFQAERPQINSASLDSTLRKFDLVDSPANIALLDANEATLIASDGKGVWLYNGEKFDQIPLGQELKITSLSAGVGETFWIVGQPVENGTPGKPVVRQYSFKGEVLRQIAGDFPATTIFADKTENRIYLTHVESPTTVIKGLRPLAVATASKEAAEPAATATPAPVTEPTEAPKQADWEVFLEKTSTLCPKFGLVDGKLVADAGATEQKDGVRLELPPSTMDQKQHTLVVHVKATKEGELWATGSGGLRLALVGQLPGTDRLRLALVGQLPGSDRVVVAKGDKPGEIKVYAGNGVVVAEYVVSGLNEIAEINAGEIELP